MNYRGWTVNNLRGVIYRPIEISADLPDGLVVEYSRAVDVSSGASWIVLSLFQRVRGGKVCFLRNFMGVEIDDVAEDYHQWASCKGN